MELTKQQIEDLNAGKAIFVEDMQRKDGELFSSYVKLDEATGRPNYTRYNPDSPEGAREIYIPKEIGGVKLTAEEQKDLREGRAIFLNDMVNNRGEEFSSFIKADLETGRLMYSRTPDGFEERAKFEIPKEIFGAKLSGQQRADLQSGKSVLVEGMKGFDGKSITQYVKLNSNQNKLDFKVEDVNWDELSGIGILKDELEQAGELETLLRGEKTGVVSLILVLLGVDVVMDATLQLVRKNDSPLLEIIGINPTQ